jgi:hypothetical protein
MHQNIMYESVLCEIIFNQPKITNNSYCLQNIFQKKLIEGHKKTALILFSTNAVSMLLLIVFSKTKAHEQLNDFSSPLLTVPYLSYYITIKLRLMANQ